MSDYFIQRHARPQSKVTAVGFIHLEVVNTMKLYHCLPIPHLEIRELREVAVNVLAK